MNGYVVATDVCISALVILAGVVAWAMIDNERKRAARKRADDLSEGEMQDINQRALHAALEATTEKPHLGPFIDRHVPPVGRFDMNGSDMIVQVGPSEHEHVEQIGELPSRTHARLDRADAARGGVARNDEATELRSDAQIFSDSIEMLPLRARSDEEGAGSMGQVEGANRAQQLLERVQGLEKQLADERQARTALPSPDAQLELNQIRTIIGAQASELTVDAIMRLMGTRRIVDGMPQSVTGRLMHAGLNVDEITRALNAPAPVPPSLPRLSAPAGKKKPSKRRAAVVTDQSGGKGAVS